MNNTEAEAAVTELRRQGLTVTPHNAPNSTWYIQNGGLYSGFIVSSVELTELRNAQKLNIQGIKDLG